MLVRFFFVAILLLTQGEARAEPTAVKPDIAPKLTMYLAKGAANSCGWGCDRWIAFEGQVDQGSAARARRFLASVKDTRRPIYFHSPGGSVEDSFVIGRLLRTRKAIARVGRTVATGCAAGTQFDDACMKIKNGNGEVEAELATRNAMCNSACGYLFLGATTREVAPDAAMAVHSSKLTVTVRGHPPPGFVDEFRRRRTVVADRERLAFMTAMGIKGELNDLIKTVKFESLHLLTRPELYRFGVDTRPVSETLWTLEKAERPYVRKIAQAKRDDGTSFRTIEWHLYCENKDRARLTLIREVDENAAAAPTMVMMAGSEKSVAFGRPARVGKYDAWSERIAVEALKPMLAAQRLQLGESRMAADGKTDVASFDIDMAGLEAAWTELLATCPAAPAAKPTIAAPSANAAPVSRGKADISITDPAGR